MASGRVPKMKSTFIGMDYWITGETLLGGNAEIRS